MAEKFETLVKVRLVKVFLVNVHESCYAGCFFDQNSRTFSSKNSRMTSYLYSNNDVIRQDFGQKLKDFLQKLNFPAL